MPPALTDGEGHYALHGLHLGQVSLRALARRDGQYWTAQANIDIQQDRPAVWSPTLAHRERLQVRVTDENQQPLVGWYVQFFGGGRSAPARRWQDLTDDTGVVRLPFDLGDSLRAYASSPPQNGFGPPHPELTITPFDIGDSRVVHAIVGPEERTGATLRGQVGAGRLAIGTEWKLIAAFGRSDHVVELAVDPTTGQFTAPHLPRQQCMLFLVAGTSGTTRLAFLNRDPAAQHDFGVLPIPGTGQLLVDVPNDPGTQRPGDLTIQGLGGRGPMPPAFLDLSTGTRSFALLPGNYFIHYTGAVQPVTIRTGEDSVVAFETPSGGPK